MATENPTTTAPQLEDSLQDMDSLFSPWNLFKKALSSFMVVFLIGGGILVNWILAAIFLLTSFSTASFISLGIGLLVFFVGFPALYFFTATLYGRALLFWEAYQEIVKPLATKIVESIFERLLPETTEVKDVEENVLAKELEEKGQGLIDRLPTFISSKLEIVSAVSNIISLIREERSKGTQKAVIKEKATRSFFDALDSQLSGLISEPSLLPVFGIAIVNIGAFIYLMLSLIHI